MTLGYIEKLDPSLWFGHVAKDPDELGQFDVDAWFTDPPETVEKISDRVVGWLLAQGWKITESEDDENAAGSKLHKLERATLKNKTVLTELIKGYIDSYNEGRKANDDRYDDVAAMFNSTLIATHLHLDRMAARHNDYEVVYLNRLDEVQSQIDSLLNVTESDAAGTFNLAGSALNTFADKLSEIGTGYDTYVTNLETILGNQQTDLTTFEGRMTTLLGDLADDFSTHQTAIDALETTEGSQAGTHITAYEAKLAELETAVTTAETNLLALVDDLETSFNTYSDAALAIITDIGAELSSLDGTISGLITDLDTAIGSHKTTHAGLVALFLSDYTTHATTTRALLVDLGTTDTARINEKWANKLTAKLQDLTDRGLYSSALITQVTTRNTRENSEDLGLHNDRLAREKLTNEHALYGQQVSVRQQQVAGEQYLFEMSKLAIDFRAHWSERLYALAVDTQKTYHSLRGSIHEAERNFISQEASVRERVLNWTLDAKKTVADGKNRVFAIRDAINRWKADSQFKEEGILRTIRGMRLDVFSKELSASLDVEKFAAASRESIVNKLNDYIKTHAQGLEAYAKTTIANGQFLAGVRLQVVGDSIATRFRYCAGLNDVDARRQKLLAYQLDARNNLAVGMFGFFERRTDGYPDLAAMGQVAAALGDAGSTQWVSQ